MNSIIKSVMKNCSFGKGFTLAEVLAVLVILGVVASITIPTTITRVRQREFVTKALRTYSSLEQATETWMIENGCVDNIEACIRKYPDGHGAFDDIAKNLNVIATTDYKYEAKTVSCNAGEEGCVNGRKTIVDAQQVNLNQDWLPERTTLYDGTKQQFSWQGVSKYSNGSSSSHAVSTGIYLLKDGTTISVQLPDNHRESGFGFFDVNGKKGPNKVGVDVYPVGWGIPYRNNPNKKANNERIFGNRARGFNPYFVEDDSFGGNGICKVMNDNVNRCVDNRRDNPTSWLLINKKIPNK